MERISSYVAMDCVVSASLRPPIVEVTNDFTSESIPINNYGSFLDNTIKKAQGADFETAIHYSRYGKFQSLLLFVCGTVYATCAISTTTLSFVLPSAECDFKLSSMDKGKLSATPLIGMLFGCSLWGSIANSQGRKVALMLSLLVDFLAAIASSLAHSFELFLVCRFFNGLGIIGATSIVFSYLGEFAAKKNRDFMLGRLEIFWNIGVILLPDFLCRVGLPVWPFSILFKKHVVSLVRATFCSLAWVLLNESALAVFADKGNFSPWRVFVLVCGLPSIISVVMLYFMPETPKFLISKGKFEKAKIVFRKVYIFNTGKAGNSYPVASLEGEFLTKKLDLNENEPKSIGSKFCRKLCGMAKELSQLFKQPYLKYLAITSFADFGLMASYYTLIMWFPEIFGRFSEFEKNHPNELASVCTVSEKNSTIQRDFFMDNCNSTINNRVFIDTFIVALSCIPSSVSLGFFMKKFGKKFVLICGSILAGLSTLSLNLVHNSTQTLALSCIFEALTSIMETVVFCVIVDLFPTNMRAMALAITATSGRLGAIMGNVVFGLLIDLQCEVPLYLFGTILIASGLLCMRIPQSEQYFALP